MGNLKGIILPDHMPLNNSKLIVPGLPTIIFTTISGLSDEIQNVDLPDRTNVSGGNDTPKEFTATTLLHHIVEQAALEEWHDAGKGDVLPTYKKSGTLLYVSLSGLIVKPFLLLGLWIPSMKLPDADMANEGDAAIVEWTFKADEVRLRRAS